MRASRWVSLPLFYFAACSPERGPTPPPLPVVGSWLYLPAGAPADIRVGATYAWTGREMFEWGGFATSCGLANRDGGSSIECGDGALLEPSSGSWRRVPAAGAPSPRDSAYAVWTGREVLVWGGRTQTDGGLFDPALSSWRPIAPAPDAFRPRRLGTIVWAGRWAIIWGGFYQEPQSGALTSLGDGLRYDVAADTWSPVAMSGAPSPRSRHTAIWSGTRMIVWGGVGESGYAGQGAAYDPEADQWTAVTVDGAPAVRQDHAAVWTGHEMIVLGGSAPDGGRYDPATDRWTALAVPSPAGFAARGPVAAWTGRKVAVWSWVSSKAAWGGLYDPATDRWEQMPPPPSQIPKRVPTFVAWTGAGVLFWAGFSWDDEDVPYSDGVVFTP